jgi:UDP:flavonoid glycosyltransferase YjiC (YdhE family)
LALVGIALVARSVVAMAWLVVCLVGLLLSNWHRWPFARQGSTRILIIGKAKLVLMRIFPLAVFIKFTHHFPT